MKTCQHLYRILRRSVWHIYIKVLLQKLYTYTRSKLSSLTFLKYYVDHELRIKMHWLSSLDRYVLFNLTLMYIYYWEVVVVLLWMTYIIYIDDLTRCSISSSKKRKWSFSPIIHFHRFDVIYFLYISVPVSFFHWLIYLIDSFLLYTW